MAARSYRLAMHKAAGLSALDVYHNLVTIDDLLAAGATRAADKKVPRDGQGSCSGSRRRLGGAPLSMPRPSSARRRRRSASPAAAKLGPTKTAFRQSRGVHARPRPRPLARASTTDSQPGKAISFDRTPALWPNHANAAPSSAQAWLIRPVRFDRPGDRPRAEEPGYLSHRDAAATPVDHLPHRKTLIVSHRPQCLPSAPLSLPDESIAFSKRSEPQPLQLRAGVRGRPVLYAPPPGCLTLGVAPPALPTADSSHLPNRSPPLT